jgi:hypothetical protein
MALVQPEGRFRRLAQVLGTRTVVHDAVVHVRTPRVVGCPPDNGQMLRGQLDAFISQADHCGRPGAGTSYRGPPAHAETPRACLERAGRLCVFRSRSAPVVMPAAVPSPPGVRTGDNDNWRRRDVDAGGRRGGRRDRLYIGCTAPQEQGAQGEPNDSFHDGTSFAFTLLAGWTHRPVHPFTGASLRKKGQEATERYVTASSLSHQLMTEARPPASRRRAPG